MAKKPHYWTTLETLWGRRRRPAEKQPRPPKGLRASAFLNEFLRQNCLSGDARFLEAAQLSIEHGFINKAESRFIRFKPQDEKWRLEAIGKEVADSIARGSSEKRACALVAVTSRVYANSFDAAVQQCRLAYRAYKKVQH